MVMTGAWFMALFDPRHHFPTAPTHRTDHGSGPSRAWWRLVGYRSAAAWWEMMGFTLQQCNIWYKYTHDIYIYTYIYTHMYIYTLYTLYIYIYVNIYRYTHTYIHTHMDKPLLVDLFPLENHRLSTSICFYAILCGCPASRSGALVASYEEGGQVQPNVPWFDLGKPWDKWVDHHILTLLMVEQKINYIHCIIFLFKNSFWWVNNCKFHDVPRVIYINLPS